MDRDKMSNLYREPSMDASYQVSVHLTKRFQKRRFLKIDQLETRIACGSHPYLLMDWDEMSHLNRNLVGSIYGMSSMVIAHAVPIR
jgi:hypothetical protein